ADGGTALADDIANAIRIDLYRDDARRELGELGARRGNRLVHDVQNVHPPLTRLLEGRVHDLAVDALDLDVHLQRGHALRGARHFEIHIAEVIFVPENVGEHGEAVVFFDETHRHARHGRRHRHAGVHEREARAAHRRHRARAVRFGDFGHDSNYVRIRAHVGQNRLNAALGETPVSDLAALRAADAAGLADRVRREVVVQHERLFALAFERVDELRAGENAVAYDAVLEIADQLEHFLLGSGHRALGREFTDRLQANFAHA